MSPLPAFRLHQTPSTVASRLSLCSYSCFFPDGLLLHHFICKKIPFPCTMILLIAGLASGLSDPTLDLRFIFQLLCGFRRAA
jgi:hypothetical protein